MGRLPKNGIRKSFNLDANIHKTRHRHADTKYRSNVQYLYSKLKEMSQNKAAKDSLLTVTLSCIQSLENDIIQKVGSDELKSYQNDFINFLLHEEVLWKMKDTVKWWTKVEEALSSHDLIENENADFTDSNRSKILRLQKNNITSNIVSSCYNSRMPPQTSVEFSAKPKKKLTAHASDFSEKDNTIASFSKFDENLFIPIEEVPESLLPFEDQNFLYNEILAEPMQFENKLF